MSGSWHSWSSLRPSEALERKGSLSCRWTSKARVCVCVCVSFLLLYPASLGSPSLEMVPASLSITRGWDAFLIYLERELPTWSRTLLYTRLGMTLPPTYGLQEFTRSLPYVLVRLEGTIVYKHNFSSIQYKKTRLFVGLWPIHLSRFGQD